MCNILISFLEEKNSYILSNFVFDRNIQLLIFLFNQQTDKIINKINKGFVKKFCQHIQLNYVRMLSR